MTASTTNALEIQEAIREDQRAEDDRSTRKPLHVIGPYEVHLSVPGWYCVTRGGSVVQTLASLTEAVLWATMQEDAE